MISLYAIAQSLCTFFLPLNLAAAGPVPSVSSVVDLAPHQPGGQDMLVALQMFEELSCRYFLFLYLCTCFSFSSIVGVLVVFSLSFI